MSLSCAGCFSNVVEVTEAAFGAFARACGAQYDAYIQAVPTPEDAKDKCMQDFGLTISVLFFEGFQAAYCISEEACVITASNPPPATGTTRLFALNVCP
jgi:hypothetical protein